MEINLKVNYIVKRLKLIVERNNGLIKTYLEEEIAFIAPNAITEIAQEIFKGVTVQNKCSVKPEN